MISFFYHSTHDNTDFILTNKNISFINLKYLGYSREMSNPFQNVKLPMTSRILKYSLFLSNLLIFILGIVLMSAGKRKLVSMLKILRFYGFGGIRVSKWTCRAVSG